MHAKCSAGPLGCLSFSPLRLPSCEWPWPGPWAACLGLSPLCLPGLVPGYLPFVVSCLLVALSGSLGCSFPLLPLVTCHVGLLTQCPPLKRGCAQYPPLRRERWPNIHPSSMDVGPKSDKRGRTQRGRGHERATLPGAVLSFPKLDTFELQVKGFFLGGKASLRCSL